MANTYKLVKDYTLVSDVQNGDKLLGQRVDGTTVRIPYQQDISQDASPTLGGNLTLAGFSIGPATSANITTLASWSNSFTLTDSFGSTILDFVGTSGTSQAYLGLDHTSSSMDLEVRGGSANSVLNIQGQGTGGVRLNSDAGGYTISANTAGNFCTSTGSNNSLSLQRDAHVANLFVADSGATVTIPTGTYTMAGQDVGHGGTGRLSHTAYTLIAGGTTSTSAQQSLAAGTSGQILLSNGSAALPTWSSDLSSGTTLNGSAIFTAADTIGVANGGTGRTSHTAYAVLCGGTTSTGAQQSVASVGTSGQVLTSNGAGALPTFQSLPSTLVYPKFFAYASSDVAISTATATKVSINTEVFDSNSNFDTTNMRFTPTVAGFYQVGVKSTWATAAATYTVRIQVYKNGVAASTYISGQTFASSTFSISDTIMIEMNGSTDYLEFFVYQDSGSNKTLYGNSSFSQGTVFWATRVD